MKENKVLVSTDIGSDPDDAMSFLAMLNNNLNLGAVYTVNGNVNARSYIAKHMVNLSGKNILVARGPSQSFDRTIKPFYLYEDCYVDDSFIDEEASALEHDIQYKPMHEAGIARHALGDLTSRLSREPHTIFSLGPLTLIAQLIEDKLDAAKNIERLYVMGGRFSGERLEHNFIYDPAAAKIVFESGVPVTLVPVDVCENYKLPVESLANLTSPAGKYVRRMAEGYAAAKTASEWIHTREELNNLSIFLLMRDIVRPNALAGKELGPREAYNIGELVKTLVVNLEDPVYGALEPDKYNTQYNELVDFLNKHKKHLDFSGTAIYYLGEAKQRYLFVSDVFVPYCFLHPDKITTRKEIVDVSLHFGSPSIRDGNMHEIVTGFDAKHFESFIRESLK